MPKSVATPLEYLKWFYMNAEFGPAHGDVMYGLNDAFEAETGKKIPPEYKYE